MQLEYLVDCCTFSRRAERLPGQHLDVHNPRVGCVLAGLIYIVEDVRGGRQLWPVMSAHCRQ